MDLFAGSDSDSEKKNNGFKINKSYAKTYEKFRRREEKQRLTDKYGDANDSESEEDEIRSTQTLDKEWLRAFALVRFNQPRLYSGEKLFKEEVKPVPKKSEEKKFTLKDQERKFILEKGGVASDEDESDIRKQRAGPSYFEEQDEIKKSLKKAIGDFDDDNEDSLLVVKDKSEHEERQEENDYLSWLKGERKELEDKEAAKELAPLKAYWSNPNLSHKETVLRDYILNNGYMDQEGKDEDSSDEDSDDVDLSEDEEFLDKADDYERNYNFRHEEPGGFEIKSYPRVIETSVRAKEESRRAERRKRLAEKKQMEKEERMEELKMLQKIQREEKEEKLLKLQELSEHPDIKSYLETDFDPEEHDKLMKKQYDDDYYEVEPEEEKPVFDDDDEAFGEDDWWQEREQAQEEEEMADDEELYADDPGFVMDADYDPNATVSKKSKKEKKKSKKNSKPAKPLFDPTTKTFDEYLDECLKDKINRLPFTYREVVPNDFGLSTKEILSAQDKELNAWVSVKRMSQYRTQDSEMYDFKKYQRKAKNQYKKYQVIPSLGPKQRTYEKSDIVKPKTPKKKKDKKDKHDESEEAIVTDGTNNSIHDASESSETLKKKQKKKKKEKLQEDAIKNEIEDSICDAGESSESNKKHKKKKKKDGYVENKRDTENSICNGVLPQNVGSDIASKKKSKKRKHEELEIETDPSTAVRHKDKLKKEIKMEEEEPHSPLKQTQNESSNSPQKLKSKKKSKKQKLNESELETSSVTPSGHNEKPKKKFKLEGNEPLEMNEKKKSKKLKKSGKNFIRHDDNSAVEFKNKKYRKNFSNLRVDVSDSHSKDIQPVVSDKKEVNRNLRMVMSKSRLSSYGLKKGGKRKMQDNQQSND